MRFSVFAREKDKVDLADSDVTFTRSCFVFAEDVFVMSSKDPKNPVIYAVFTTSRYRPDLFMVTSTMCLHRLKSSNSLTHVGSITFVLSICCWEI